MLGLQRIVQVRDYFTSLRFCLRSFFSDRASPKDSPRIIPQGSRPSNQQGSPRGDSSDSVSYLEQSVDVDVVACRDVNPRNGCGVWGLARRA